MKIRIVCHETQIFLALLLMLSFLGKNSFALLSSDTLLLPKNYTEQTYKHILNISNVGIHSVGTKQEKEVANYIQNEFEKMGLSTTIESFDFESFDYTKVKLHLNNHVVSVQQLCFNPYTTEKRSYEGEFILLNDENKTTEEIEDRVVVAQYPLENQTFFNLFFQNPQLIVVINRKDFKELQLERGRNLKCNIVGNIHRFHSQNVVGEIKAPVPTSNEIILSAHYDSYPGSLGADDNASGVGALIELARFFSKNQKGLTHNLKFVAFGGEEKGLVGSRAYLEAHRSDIANCKLLLNIDQVGGKDIFIETTGGVKGTPPKTGTTQFPEYMRNRSLEGIHSNWRIIAPEAMAIFSVSNRPEWLAKMITDCVNELDVSVSFAGNTGSDQMTFAQAGIVSTAIGSSGNKYHGPGDVPSQIVKETLYKCGNIVLNIVRKMMSRSDLEKVSVTSLPRRKFQYDIREQMELENILRFLASDEMRGRKTGSPEANIAARFIAEKFRTAGIKSFPTFNEFLQPILLKKKESSVPVKCNNVVGYLEGSDSLLKNEYVLLVAHYDHLGVKNDALTPGADSIYNGARDDAMGVTALIYAAKKLSMIKSKRSTIFLATSGEEDGMLGSKYFTEHSPVPIKKIVFVLNNDGGGYNDTTLIRVGGKELLKYPFDIWKELEYFGVKALPYPNELKYLYNLGDNISFANLGIPSITISPGFDKVDDQLLKFVHQPSDEANDDFDYKYLYKFSKVYTEIARIIEQTNELPKWEMDSDLSRAHDPIK